MSNSNPQNNHAHETPHQFPVRIYYQDTDAAGVVYHSTYANFAERSRTELFRSLGITQTDLKQNHAIIFVVKKLISEFIKPAHLDDEIYINSTISHIGKASLTMQQNFTRKSCLITKIEVLLVAVALNNFKPISIPNEIKNILTSYAKF